MAEGAPSSFEIRAPTRILFGRGVFSQAPACAAPFGRRALVVTGLSALRDGPRSPSGADSAGSSGGRADHGSSAPVTESQQRPRESPAARAPDRGDTSESLFATLASALEKAGLSVVHLIVRHEPTVETVDEGTRRALAAGCDLVIGLGGGSVLDAAKAVSGLMTNGGSALDYLEVVGRGRVLESPAAPFIAIPTTSGTGSEATKNAVLTEPRSRVKASLRSPHLLPVTAIVDPDLTLSLPSHLTASTGLDALTQLVEAYITPRANPFTDMIALEGIERSARALLTAVNRGTDLEAREDLALASLFGGIALANAGLGAVHGIAASLGGRFSVPHGVACAVMLPHVMRTNVEALRRDAPAGPALRRIERIGEILARAYPLSDGSIDADRGEEESADVAVRLLRDLVGRCRIGGLAGHGVTASDLPGLAEAALRASSMKGNPVPLSHGEIVQTLERAL